MRLLIILIFFGLVGCSIKEREMDHELVTLSRDRVLALPSIRESPTTTDLKNAYFDYDKSDLKKDAKQALRSDAKWLKANPLARVQIEGYCDEKGSYEYNLELGRQRAEAARQFLVRHGVESSRLVAVGVGRIPGSGDNTRARNRRAGFVVLFEN